MPWVIRCVLVGYMGCLHSLRCRSVLSIVLYTGFYVCFAVFEWGGGGLCIAIGKGEGLGFGELDLELIVIIHYLCWHEGSAHTIHKG